MTEEHTVLYELNEGVATLTLNRPDVFNAFNAQLHVELIAALRRVERDAAARCVVITGAGKAFGSGQDLREVPAEGVASMIGERIRTRYNPLISTIHNMPKPVIAAVNGVAAGASFSLALACDFRIASASARFVAAFVNIGLVPDSGMTYFLPRLIGPSRALHMCMTGEPVDAAMALQWGMVNAVASAEEFPATVHALAERLANSPATALSLIKRALVLSPAATLEQMLEYEALAQPIAGAHPDFVEGVTAFKEKRAPKYR